MERCERQDSTASASRLLTFRLVAMELLLGSGSGGTGRVVHRRVPALAVCPAQLRQVLLGEHRGQHRDPAAVYPDLAVAQGAAQHDTAATRGVRPGRVLDLATAG